jgi:hypothetical protein
LFPQDEEYVFGMLNRKPSGKNKALPSGWIKMKAYLHHHATYLRSLKNEERRQYLQHLKETFNKKVEVTPPTSLKTALFTTDNNTRLRLTINEYYQRM